jgi:serine protease Do
VRALLQDEREATDVKNGVAVTDVDQNSFAEEVGVQPGDVIVEINRQPVASAADVKRIAGEVKPGQPVAFKVLRALPGSRGMQALFLAGTLPNS